jgi:hypothetical protein
MGSGGAGARSGAKAKAASSGSGPTLSGRPFAERVVSAARTVPPGQFSRKVFIHHAYEAARDQPGFKGMTLDQFKARLVESNRAGHLELSRADLVEAMNPEDVRRSNTHVMGATFNFIRIP